MKIFPFQNIFRLFDWPLCLIISMTCHLNGRAQNILQEKIFVHTDKNYYHSGEIIWFRIYNVEGTTHQPVDISKLAYAEILDSANKSILQGKILLKKGAGSGSFSIPGSCISGKYRFRSYTNWMKNFPAQLFFEKEIVIINTQTSKKAFIFSSDSAKISSKKADKLNIRIRSDKSTYNTRQNVRMELSSMDANGKPVIANLSVSVYRLDSLISTDPLDIHEYLSGLPSVPSTSDFPNAPEFNGHIVTGKVINRVMRTPGKGIMGYLSIPGDPNSFCNSKSDSLGRIKFEVKNLSTTDSIIVQTNTLSDPEYKIEIESPFSNVYTSQISSGFIPVVNNPVTLLDQSINVQVMKIYHAENLDIFNRHSRDSVPFYGKEDSRYLLDNYTRFNRMEDVFREYVRPVGVNRRGGNFHLLVYNEPSIFLFEKDPLVLLDGTPVFSIDRLFTFDPLKVKSIDVITRKYFRGSSAFEGIVSLTTYNGNFDGATIDSNATVIEYEGLQKQRLFYSPTYETTKAKASRVPDFRNVLYWDPSISTNSAGTQNIGFYTSDLEGDFVVIVQGITSNGQTGRAIFNFEVKKSDIAEYNQFVQ